MAAAVQLQMFSVPGNDTTIYWIPGILSRGLESIMPVGNTIAGYGTVYVANFPGPFFQPEEAARRIAVHAGSQIHAGKKVVFIGSSLGGRLIPDVLRNLSTSPDIYVNQRGMRERLHTLMVDAPVGASTFAYVPRYLGPAAKLASYALRPSERANRGYGATVMSQLTKELPKDENIIVPDSGEAIMRMCGAPLGPDSYRECVKRTAAANLSGHEFTLYASQLRWMLQTPVNFDAMGLVAYPGYVACTGDNVTVRQPLARDTWKRRVPEMELDEVESAHCAYLEAYPLWASMFRDWLDSRRL